MSSTPSVTRDLNPPASTVVPILEMRKERHREGVAKPRGRTPGSSLGSATPTGRLKPRITGFILVPAIDPFVACDFLCVPFPLISFLYLKRFPVSLLSCHSLDPPWWAAALEGGVETWEAVFEEAFRGQQRGVSE